MDTMSIPEKIMMWILMVSALIFLHFVFTEAHTYNKELYVQKLERAGESVPKSFSTPDHLWFILGIHSK